MGTFNFDGLQAGFSLDTPIDLTLQGVAMGGGGSGRVPAGRYQLTIKKCEVVRKKEKPGFNIAWEYEVAGPTEYAGVILRAWHPAPETTSNKDMTSAGASTLARQVASFLSGVGRLDEYKTKEAFKIALQNLVGKALFAKVRDSKDTRYNNSEIEFYILKDEFDARPGPDAPATTGTTTATGRTELLPNGNAGAGVQPQVGF